VNVRLPRMEGRAAGTEDGAGAAAGAESDMGPVVLVEVILTGRVGGRKGGSAGERKWGRKCE
jgi:hypothetical protein